MQLISPSRFALSRRSLLAGAGISVVASAMPVRAQSPSSDIVLTGGHVLTMENGSAPVAMDIHVRNGEIVSLADHLDITGAQRLDLAGALVMPGLVDTHWHMWNSLARGFAMSRLGPFAKTMAPLARVWTPEAAALSVKVATAEAINSGITTVNNWAHNTKSLEFATAEYAAMTKSGIRGRFSYGYPQALKPDERMDFDALDSFVKTHQADQGLLHVGLCTRGPDRSKASIWKEEWQFARDRHLPITTHIASDRKAAEMKNIAGMAKQGLLGPDVQLVHATHATRDDFLMIKDAGSPVSISPWTELEVGYGVPPVALMAETGIVLGLSVDNMVLAGNADMFSVMKITADLAAGQTETQGKVSDRTVLDWATRGGAKGLGLDSRIGILSPGMRADIIAVRTEDLNTVGAMNPDFALTHSAQPQNVEFAMIDGVVHKSDGRLAMIDEQALVDQSEKMISDLRQKAGL
jgi:cytosine/adenosine deaminase-related metal-dependent hydrolase